VVDESTDAYGVRRVTVEGTATSGYVGDRGAILDTLVTQLRTGAKVATVDLSWQPATLLWNTPEGESLTLERLATGRSNFAKSPNGRSFNVQKALTERLNGAVAAPDESFSFNRVLKGASGWKEALGIFEGGELRPVQGGGICQAATTLYRAIALAGLPVDSRASHSLYVTYYSAHGVGLDATIFPGAQDLRFTNDTGAPVVMLARHEGDEAYVDLFGLNDGRSVVLTGPFFSENAPADVLVNNRAVRANEIVWQQAVTWPDGRQASNLIVSRYKSIPRSVPGQYPVGTLTNEEPPVAGGL
jgi:vancomycin resistance protein YoaR